MIELSAGLNHGIEGLFDNIPILTIKHPAVGILIAHIIVIRKVKHMRTELREVVLSGHGLIYCDVLTVFTGNILPPPSIEPATFFKLAIGKYTG